MTALPRPVRTIAQEIAVVGAALGCVLLSHPTGFPWSEAAAIVACVTLPLRLRWPWLAMIFCLWALSGELGLAPALVGLYRIGRTEKSPWITATWATIAVIVVETTVLTINPVTLRDGILSVGFSILWMLSPSALGMLVTTRQNLAASLAELRRAQEAELEAKAEQAKAQERARIGQEIHDAVGHHATLIAVEAAALAATTTESETRLAAQRMRGQAKASLAEMRAALGLVNEGENIGGLADVPALVAQAKESGMPITLNVDDGPAVRPVVGRAIFRIVRESLTNAAKHAPGAPVSVNIERTEAELITSITSGPQPTPTPTPATPDSGGQGLSGMAERAKAAGGRLDATGGADGVFTVSARFPLPTTPKVAPTNPTIDGSEEPLNTR
jgi:signal transduction histidine kinase